MRLSYLTDEALATLRAQLPQNLSCYASNDQNFFSDILEDMQGERWDSSLVFPDFELDETSDYSISDTRNVRVLYSAMRNLSPSIACDERLWVGLAHGYFWDYVQYRQAKQIASLNEQQIATSFFFTNGHRRSLYVNCLSRLWWIGFLTYDESNSEDPFALTDLITKQAFPSRSVIFSSSNITANKQIGLGVLDSIKKREQAGEEIERKHFVGPLKYLNSMGGITVLDVLSRSETTKIIDEYLASEAFRNMKLVSRKKGSKDAKASVRNEADVHTAVNTRAKQAEQVVRPTQPEQPTQQERHIEPLQTIALEKPAQPRHTSEPEPSVQYEAVPAYDPVIDNLEFYGFEYVDNRDVGGALWVVASEDFEGIAEYWRDKSVVFEYTERGGKAVGWRPSWWTNDASPE